MLYAVTTALHGHLWLRAPNHLGDGVMALPAIRALVAAAERSTIGAPRWGAELYAGLSADVVEREAVPPDADVAVLFPPSFRVAWQARRVPQRVGVVGDWRGWLLSHGVRVVEGHRRVQYAALAAQLGVEVSDPPRFEATGSVAGQMHVGLNPVSASGQTVDWPHFGALAHRLAERGVPVTLYAGLGDSQALRDAIPSAPGLSHAPEHDLGALAAALAHCRLFVSNDSGLGHFAAACGTPVLTLYGSTASERTGPAGAQAIEPSGFACRPCYRKQCPYADPAVPCLEAVGVDEVEARVLAAWGEQP